MFARAANGAQDPQELHQRFPRENFPFLALVRSADASAFFQTRYGGLSSRPIPLPTPEPDWGYEGRTLDAPSKEECTSLRTLLSTGLDL